MRYHLDLAFDDRFKFERENLHTLTAAVPGAFGATGGSCFDFGDAAAGTRNKHSNGCQKQQRSEKNRKTFLHL